MKSVLKGNERDFSLLLGDEGNAFERNLSDSEMKESFIEV
jgi:hypothetical protein